MGEQAIIDQTTGNVVEDELYRIDHDVWIATEATKLGFPVAGNISEIYEDAVILIPPLFRFDWKGDKVKRGRVLEILHGGHVLSFVLRIEDGPQTTCMYGESYPCYFALPETTEDLYRGG